MTWIDWTVGGIVLVVGLIILYRALKEPLDLLFSLISRGLASIRDWITGAGSNDKYEVIRYG